MQPHLRLCHHNLSAVCPSPGCKWALSVGMHNDGQHEGNRLSQTPFNHINALVPRARATGKYVNSCWQKVVMRFCIDDIYLSPWCEGQVAGSSQDDEGNRLKFARNSKCCSISRHSCIFGLTFEDIVQNQQSVIYSDRFSITSYENLITGTRNIPGTQIIGTPEVEVGREMTDRTWRRDRGTVSPRQSVP